MAWLFNTFLFLSSFIVVLSVLVFIHEMGHYSVARFFKVSIDKFSIGFGKPLLKRTDRHGTEWVVSRVPFGGFVKFSGDMGMASNPDHEQLAALKEKAEAEGKEADIGRLFHFKPLWQKALVVLAGPVANFLLAIVIFAIVVMTYENRETKSHVISVTSGGAAEAAGVLAGDHFLTMDGHDVTLYRDLSPYVSLRSGSAIKAVVLRDGREVELTIEPQRKDRKDFVGGTNKTGTIGVNLGGEGASFQQRYNPVEALGYGINEVGRTVSSTGTYIGRIFSGKEDGSALGGPLRIATLTGKTAVDVAKLDRPLGERLKAGFFTLLQLGAYLSIGLGVANLMPIPVLDGGHLLFYGYEAVAGRPLSQEKQEIGFRFGFALLLTLFVFLTFNDVGYIRSFFS
ncbi:MAG: M50 family metallopeptidase [Maricaulaceae bacterium]